MQGDRRTTGRREACNFDLTSTIIPGIPGRSLLDITCRTYFFFLADFFFAAAFAGFAFATLATFLAAAFLTALAGAFFAGADLALVFLPFPKADSQPEAYFSLVPTRVIVTCFNLSQHLNLST